MLFTVRVFPIPNFIFKGSLVDPLLRASNEHILDRACFASRRTARLPFTSFSGRAFREHRTNVDVLLILYIAGGMRARRMVVCSLTEAGSGDYPGEGSAV
jgi:hypothetical protein